MYHTPHCNTIRPISSFAPQINANIVKNFPKTPVIPEFRPKQTVSYRTQEYLDDLKLRLNSDLKHPTSGKRKALGCFIKFVIGTHQEEEAGLCAARVSAIGCNMKNSGYEKDLSGRQIRRVSKEAELKGYITRTRTKQKNGWLGFYKFEPTRLGLDMYYLYIMRNTSHFIIKAEEFPLPSVDNLVVESQPTQEAKKMAALETPVIIEVFDGLKKNGRTYNSKKNIRSQNNIIRVDQLGITLQNQTPITPIPEPEEKIMLQSKAEIPKRKPVDSDPQVKQSGMIDYNATAIDLDAPPADILLFNWDHTLTGDRTNTVKLGKVNYKIPEGHFQEKPAQQKPLEWQSETQTKPSYARSPKLLDSTKELFVAIATTPFHVDEQKIIINELVALKENDELKLKILDATVRMFETRKQTGHKKHNIPLILRDQINYAIKSQKDKILSTEIVDN